MMKKYILGIIFILLGMSYPQAQENAKQKVQKTIETLFAGMIEVDTNKVRATFHESARMQTVFFHPKKQKTMVHTEDSIDGFLKQIASAQKGMFDERISKYVINIDGKMASVWTPYEFYLNGEFSHCGVNSFQLVKVGEAWQIVYIIDTRRKENCE